VRREADDGDQRQSPKALLVDDDWMREELAGILNQTDRILREAIGAAAGVTPHLAVVDQWRVSPPIPAPLAPPLSLDSDVLGRCTSYGVDGVSLSWNVSYVDLGRVDPALATKLETNQLNLGDLFVDPNVKKSDFEFGTHADAGEFDRVLRSRLSDADDDLGPYVWRRYTAAMRGVAMFLVIEALPASSWNHFWTTKGAPGAEAAG